MSDVDARNRLRQATVMTMASLRITDGLRYLDREISASRDEFRADNQPDGAHLLQAAINLGYIRRGMDRDNIDRVALTEAGRRRLGASDGRTS